MEYRKFINDAPEVSVIGIGAWQLGESKDWESMTDKESEELIQKSLQLGINFFDTAPNYGYGTSETRLGNALKNVKREEIVINTKFGHPSTGGVNFESSHIRESLEGSLKRLGTDYVDSLIIHNPPSKFLDGRITDHYEILERLQTEGKIKEYGASLDTYDDMKLFMETTNGKVIEAFFNILHQDSSRAFEMAKEKGVGIIVKIPLDSGWLSGKYNAESTFSDIRKRWSKSDIEQRAKLVESVKQILGSDERIIEKSISFCFSFDAVSTVIPGNKSISQLLKNVASLDHRVTEEEKAKLIEFYFNEVEGLKIPW